MQGEAQEPAKAHSSSAHATHRRLIAIFVRHFPRIFAEFLRSQFLVASLVCTTPIFTPWKVLHC